MISNYCIYCSKGWIGIRCRRGWWSWKGLKTYVRYILKVRTLIKDQDQHQGAGRAGRDGKQSHVVIMYHGQQLGHCEEDAKLFIKTSGCYRVAAYRSFDPNVNLGTKAWLLYILIHVVRVHSELQVYNIAIRGNRDWTFFSCIVQWVDQSGNRGWQERCERCLHGDIARHISTRQCPWTYFLPYLFWTADRRYCLALQSSVHYSRHLSVSASVLLDTCLCNTGNTSGNIRGHPKLGSPHTEFWTR